MSTDAREHFSHNQETLRTHFTSLLESRIFDGFDGLCELTYMNAVVHGWHDKYAHQKDKIGRDEAQMNQIVEKLFMISTEAAELVEALRGKKQDWRHANIEMADVLIRAMDAAQMLLSFSKENGKLEDADSVSGFVMEKTRQNIERSYLHGDKRV